MWWHQCWRCLYCLWALNKFDLIGDYKCIRSRGFGSRIKFDTCSKCSIGVRSPIREVSACSIGCIGEHRKIGRLSIGAIQVKTTSCSLAEVTNLGCVCKAPTAIWNLVMDDVAGIGNPGLYTRVTCCLRNLDSDCIARYGTRNTGHGWIPAELASISRIDHRIAIWTKDSQFPMIQSSCKQCRRTCHCISPCGSNYNTPIRSNGCRSIDWSYPNGRFVIKENTWEQQITNATGGILPNTCTISGTSNRVRPAIHEQW